MTSHLFIPDTQVKPGVNIDHIKALGNYIVDHKPDVIICIGDWFDLPSLSSYESKGSKYFHDKTYREDIDAGINAMWWLMNPLTAFNINAVIRKKKTYKPRLIYTLGNHEQRIIRAINESPILQGTIGYKDLQLENYGWEVYDYLQVVEIDKILYSHYFINPDSLMSKPIGGTIENKLRLLGHSFSMGHQQKRQYGIRYDGRGQEIHGLVAGAFYTHNEDYLGPQGNNYWRGVVYKHEVRDGRYDPCFISVDYLIREWL